MDSVEAVEKILNYSFTDKNLLKEAITQTSCRFIESSPLFERLEFLGDSVLELVITNYIHLAYPNLNLTELIKIRYANVSNENFARVAVNHNLHQCLILEDPNPFIDKKIKDFSEAVAEEDDPAPYGGLVKAPKILADLVESIAGAVFIDVNYDLQRVCEIFRGLLLAANEALRKLSKCMPIENIVDEDNLDVEIEDVKRKLFEICSTEKIRLQTGSSSLLTTSENSLPYEMTPDTTVMNEDSLHFELEDVKRKLFEICATEKQSESSSLPTASEDPFTYEVTPTKMVFDEDSPHAEPEDVKGESFKICSTEKQTESSSLPAASEDPFTYEGTPTKMVFDEDSPHVEPEDVKGESFKICSTEKQTETSSLPTPSEDPFTYEVTPTKMVFDEDSPHVEPEDVKGESFKICSTEKLRSQTESSSLPTTSENLLTDEMTQEQMVFDENSPHVEPEDAKGKLFEIFSTRKLQIQTGSSSLPNTSANPLTYEMTIKQMVADEDSLEVEPKNTKLKLFGICAMNKWPNPIFSVEDERGPKNEHRFVCSVKIEIPTVEGTFHMKGDAESTKKQAENSSAYHMIRALESSLMSLVISNLQMQESLDSMEAVEKILNYSFTNKNLLKEALTHNSSRSPLLQRLMFVGKPALSLAFTNHIYLTYPKVEPKELDLLRSVNTCNHRFARLVVKHGIYKFIICNVPKSERKIMKFIELMGKEDDPDPYRFVKAPKLLVDLVISVAGAVYIDVNLDVKRFWEILRSLFEPIYTLDDLPQQPHPLLTLLCLGYKHGKRVEFRYRKSDNQTTIAEVYLDDKFIACGNPNKWRGVAKMNAAKVALQKLSEGMPIEMVMHDYIEYEDAKEKLIEICNDRKLTNPIFSFESSERGYVCSVKIETPTEEGTLCIEGNRKKRRKIAENNAASHMIRTLKSSPLNLVIRNLHMQQILDEKKNLKMQKSLENEQYLQLKERKQQSLDEKGNLQMQNSLDENKTPQMQNSLDEKKNLRMQNSLDENKNPQMQNSLDENENLHGKKRKRKRR